MMHTLEYQGQALSYSVLTNKRLKHLSIHIHPHKGIVIKNPGFSAKDVHRMVQQKAAWIVAKTLSMQERLLIPSLLEQEGKLLYLGEAILAPCTHSPEAFYREKTPHLVKTCVEKWAFIMGVSPKEIRYRKTKRRWGSCSHHAELTFTLTLAQLPLACIEYIVIHELSHIKHPHHKSSFWKCVEAHMPSYKEQEKCIKRYSPALS